eukprot:gene10364-19065_t
MELPFCDSIVFGFEASQSAFIHEKITPEQDHWDRVLPRLSQFWQYCELPEILGKRRWTETINDLVAQMREYCGDECYNPVHLQQEILEHYDKKVLITGLNGKANVEDGGEGRVETRRFENENIERLKRTRGGNRSEIIDEIEKEIEESTEIDVKIEEIISRIGVCKRGTVLELYTDLLRRLEFVRRHPLFEMNC